MTLLGNGPDDGWQHQAVRLAVTHGLFKAKARHGEEQFDATVAARERELTDALELAQAKATGFERRWTQETAVAQGLREQLRLMTEQSGAADTRIVELEDENAALHDAIALRDNEAQSLQTSLDLTIAENARLAQRLQEADAALDSARAQLERLQKTLAAVAAERTSLAGEVFEANGRRQIETGALNDKLEAMSSRARIAEQLLADTRESLRLRIADNSIVEGKLAQTTAAGREADGKVKQLQDLLYVKQYEVNELERSRLELVAATNTLLESHRGRDAALVQADDEIRSLNKRIAQLSAAGESRVERKALSAPQPASAPRATADDAGDKARRNLAELAGALTKLVTLRRQFSAPLQAHSTPALLASTITF